MSLLEIGAEFRHVFILDSRNWFDDCRDRFDPACDLVLTYDFALKHEIEGMGGKAFYVDHLIDNQVMLKNNFLVYKFFLEWPHDADGKDIFTYERIPFGFSFRLDLWNEYLFYVRARSCLERLREVKFEAVFAGTDLGLVETILEEMGIRYFPVSRFVESNLPRYYFRIHDWMTENIRRRGIKARVLNLLTWSLGSLLCWVDRASGNDNRKPAVYVQDYHPTRKLIQRLKRDSKVRVVGASVTRTQLWSRYIPLWAGVKRFEPFAEKLMEEFRARRCAKLVLTNGLDISASIYSIFERRVTTRIAESARVLDCVIRYLDRNPIRMLVLIANIGEFVTLLDCACKARGVPSYLIVNGLQSGDFLDDGKYATVINSYGTSVKENYFRGMDNVVCLGDPRMDAYPRPVQPRTFDKDSFTVTIGASGFSNIDLNSYVAVEFDFMFDVLKALSRVKKQGVDLRVVIKVRANGYLGQYRQFTKEYFPGVVDEIVDKVPMKEVLEKSDFYISIYSQTMFEASCLGVPCLYYKKDNEILDPPFDGESELVTVGCVEALVDAIGDFRRGHARFDAFLQRSVMEKYIGPLDGGNLERNLRFIYDFLNQREAEIVA